MKRFKSVAIVGVGLIGGSVGLALRRRKLAEEIVGIGRRASSLRKAKRLGVVDRTTTDLARGLTNAELVVICTPPETIIPITRQAASVCRPGTLITDVGSTKAELVAALDKNLGPGARFVGSHPLAGDHRTGPEYARADLLDDHVVIVTPTRRTRAADVKLLSEFWTSLGARVVKMTAGEHDRTLALTSHMPHVVAAAVANATPEEALQCASTGWLDTTRIAAGDVELWQQILLSNRKNVVRAIRRVQRSLEALQSAIDGENSDRLETLLTEAKRNRDALGS